MPAVWKLWLDNTHAQIKSSPLTDMTLLRCVRFAMTAWGFCRKHFFMITLKLFYCLFCVHVVPSETALELNNKIFLTFASFLQKLFMCISCLCVLVTFSVFGVQGGTKWSSFFLLNIFFYVSVNVMSRHHRFNTSILIHKRLSWSVLQQDMDQLILHVHSSEKQFRKMSKCTVPEKSW